MGTEDYNDFQTLVTRGDIKRKNLKQNQYTVSLMNEGLRTGLLNSQETYGIQNRLMLVLQNLIKRYTQGKSSSVTTETAESLFISMIYAVDAFLKSMETPEEAMTCLKKVDTQSIYENGVKIVSKCFEETKQLYNEVKKNKLDVPVDAYNMTIDESLPVFMKKYGIIFDAHNTMASIDYPLAIDDMRLQGVFYIRQYLERLQIETNFCRFFSHEDILHMLVNFGRVSRFDYRIELFNIYELMLHNAVFSVISGGKASQVKISEYQFELLERELTQATPSQIDFLVREAMVRLQNELYIIDPSLTEYMGRCRDTLVQRIVNTAHSRSLHALILTRQEERLKPIEFSLNPDDHLSDIELRKLLAEIMKSDKKEDKALLIKSSLYSLHDYLDVFESDSLYGDEYDAVFFLFGDTELAILAKIVFYEDLRSDFLDFETIVADSSRSDGDWRSHYIEFMQRLDADRLRSIEKLINMIDYEEIKFY